MVTLQAKQQPFEHQQQQQRQQQQRPQQQQQQPQPPQQQQRLSPRSQRQQREAVVADDDSWNPQQRRINGGGGGGDNDDDDDVHAYNRRCGISDDWTIAYNATNGLRVDDGVRADRDERAIEVASTRVEGTSTRGPVTVAGGSNGESTQCSDIEDEDDAEIGEGLEEEEEEEGEDDDEDDDEEEDGEEGEVYEVDEVDTDEDGEVHAVDNKDAGNQLERSDRWIKKKVVTTRVQHQTSFGDGYGRSEAVPHLDETTFGEVSVKNSQHVHVGNTNYYKGPVTIKQFVYTNAYPVLDKDDDTEGSSSARVSDINPNDVPIVKSNPNGPILPNHRDYDYDSVTKWLWTWRCAAILCVTALSLVTIVAVVSVLLTKNESVSRPIHKVPDTPGPGSEETELPTSVRIIEREFWNAQPPSTKLDKLRVSPTPYVIISHTATEACLTQSACVLRVRLIQTLHIESFGWDDIGYNFLVGGDGLAYRARGWDLAGSHAFGYNYNSMGISFIGTFNDVEPNKLQLAAAKNLIEFGMNLSKIAPTYKLLGHRQVSKTLSPGDQLYRIIQSWDHWSSYPPPNVMTASTANRPYPSVLLPLFVIIIIITPYLLLLCQRSFGILFHAVPVGLCNAYRYTHDMFYELR